MRFTTLLRLALRALLHHRLRTVLTTSVLAAAVSAVHIHQTLTLRPAERSVMLADRFESRFLVAYESLSSSFEQSVLEAQSAPLAQLGVRARHDFLCGYFAHEDDPIPVLLCSLPQGELPEWQSLYALTQGRMPQPGAREALIDEGYAQRRGLRLGDALTVYRKRPPLTVTGLYTRAAQLPTAEVYAPLVDVQALREREGAVGLSLLELSPGADPKLVAPRAAELLPELQVRPGGFIAERLRAGIRPIQLASGALALVIGVLCGAIGVLTLFSAVNERRRDFATARALGIGRRALFAQVLVEGGAMGLYGTFKGLLIGEALLRALGPRLHPVFAGGSLPSEFLIPAAVGLGLTGLGALLPAWHASRASPAELLRA